MASRQRLLYLSPVIPATAGNGLAMRAGMVLGLLAERYSVSLLVVPLYPSPSPMTASEIASLCEQTATLPRPQRAAASAYPFVEEVFDVVHVFRLATLPYARPYLAPFDDHLPARHLDLDDVESVTHLRLAGLYRLNGDEIMARREEAEAERAARLEAEVLSQFDRVYVCSQADRQALVERGARGSACYRTRSQRRDASPIPPAGGDRPFTFLFVGTLGYFPNADAVRWFCSEVLPLLRQIAPRDFRLTIVGTGATAALRDVADLPEVGLVGAVPDVAPWYDAADAVAIPIRAGGGTRIKVLEAFRYQRPVVSTSAGVEGIDGSPGQHFLIGDTPADLAAQCARLMAEPGLADTLAEQGFALFMRAYTTRAVATIVATCSASPHLPGEQSGGASPGSR